MLRQRRDSVMQVLSSQSSYWLTNCNARKLCSDGNPCCTDEPTDCIALQIHCALGSQAPSVPDQLPSRRHAPMRTACPIIMQSGAMGRTISFGRGVGRLPRKQLRGSALHTFQPQMARARNPQRHTRITALVNVDLNPALLLGVGMMGSGLALYTVRSKRPEISKDSDVFFSSIAILVGGILIFQVKNFDLKSPCTCCLRVHTSGSSGHGTARSALLTPAADYC